MKEKKKLSLAVQIFIGLVLGIVAGLIFMVAGKADWAVAYVKPFGTIFLNLLKFIVVPIVLFSIMAGVISMRDIKKVGSIGWKTVVYYMDGGNRRYLNKIGAAGEDLSKASAYR